MKKIYKFKRKTVAGVPNLNGYTYAKESFDNAMKKYIDDGFAYVCMGRSVSEYRHVNINHLYSPLLENVLGFVVGYDDETISVEIDDESISAICKEFLNEYIIPSIDIIKIYMIYSANNDNAENIIINRIKYFDIPYDQDKEDDNDRE